MFMNRVHEQRPKIDLGTIPSQNGSKIGRVHRVHSPRPARAPSAQAACLPRLAACCRALLRACRLPSSPNARTPVPPAACRLRAPAPAHLRAPPSAARLLVCPSQRPTHAQRPAASPAPACALLRAQPSACVPCRCYSGRIVAWLGTVLQYSPALPSPLLTIQLYCIATQIELAYAAIHLSPLTVLQYSLLSQHLSCNKKWAVAHQNFLLKIFFRFSL